MSTVLSAQFGLILLLIVTINGLRFLGGHSGISPKRGIPRSPARPMAFGSDQIDSFRYETGHEQFKTKR